VTQRIMQGLVAAMLVLIVVDGDSITVDGERIRIMGLDAPEMHCRCARECTMARDAKAELTRILEAPAVIERHGKDRYGRMLARVTVGGQDVADRMIAAGLARPYHGERRQPWC
jgi:micrococcal nuclease